MPLDFTAIDFETANSSSASACAVGLVKIRGGRVTKSDGWLIKPPPGHDAFFEINTRIHGIQPENVTGAPGWSEQLPRLLEFIGQDTLVAHNAGFDMSVMHAASVTTHSQLPQFAKLCSLQVARRVYQLDSYRLPNVAAAAGFRDFKHHDAIADAAACAHIICDSAKRTQAQNLAELAQSIGLQITLSKAATATQ